MTMTNAWKKFKKRGQRYVSITEFSDILARKMIEYEIITEEEDSTGMDTPISFISSLSL